MGVLTAGQGIALNQVGSNVEVSATATPGSGLPDKEAGFNAAGTIPVPFRQGRVITAAPTVYKDAGTPVITYRYAATPGGTLSTIATWPHTAAAESWVLVTVTDMSTATLVAVSLPVS